MMADETSYRFIWKILFLAVVLLDVQMVFVEGEVKSTDSTGKLFFVTSRLYLGSNSSVNQFFSDFVDYGFY